MSADRLPACATEDQTAPDCYWDAQTQGNGIGEDFIVCDGTVIYTQVDASDDYTANFIPSCPAPEPTPLVSDLPSTGGLAWEPFAFLGLVLTFTGLLLLARHVTTRKKV